MNTVVKITEDSTTSWETLAADLGETLAAGADERDANNEFVIGNYALLREHGFFKMIIPAELGGGGADYAEVSAVIRELARHCGSTALAFAMHTHPWAVKVYTHLGGF